MSGAALVRGDALAIPLGDATVDLIVTSPPYFALRSYRDGGEHYDGQIGAEPTPQDFLDALWAVTAECGRVLKPSGSLWVNLGDKYAGTGGGNGQTGLGNESVDGDVDKFTMPRNNTKQTSGLVPRKSLMGLPWRYAIGCTDGKAGVCVDPAHRHTGDTWEPFGPLTPCTLGRWILRAEVIWSKPNGLPESVTDRVRRSHEQWFHFTKEPRYFAAVDEIREPHQHKANGAVFGGKKAVGADAGLSDTYGNNTYDDLNPLGKLPGSVWTIPTEPLIVPDELGVDHFAAFPSEWPRRIISGWSPSGICTVCGEGRTITITRDFDGDHNAAEGARQRERSAMTGGTAKVTLGRTDQVTRTITGEACACPTPDAPTRPAVVLDPFGGTGTTAMVARALGRFGVSLDLSADYLRLARWRVFDSGGAEKVARRSAERATTPDAAERAADAAARLADPDQLGLFSEGVQP